jgi:hypothetical protein
MVYVVTMKGKNNIPTGRWEMAYLDFEKNKEGAELLAWVLAEFQAAGVIFDIIDRIDRWTVKVER